MHYKADSRKAYKDPSMVVSDWMKRSRQMVDSGMEMGLSSRVA